MNPDIQRIAEKWAEGYKDPQVSAYEVIKAALEELSALRDTQEREQLDSIRLQGENLRNLMEAAHHGWMKERVKTSSLLGKIHDLRAELARRDEVEKELRGDIVDLETKIKCRTNLWDKANKENVSLRSRIGELEGKYGVQEQLDHIFGQLPSNEDT